jgi:hypothetical protein
LELLASQVSIFVLMMNQFNLFETLMLKLVHGFHLENMENNKHIEVSYFAFQVCFFSLFYANCTVDSTFLNFVMFVQERELEQGFQVIDM